MKIISAGTNYKHYCGRSSELRRRVLKVIKEGKFQMRKMKILRMTILICVFAAALSSDSVAAVKLPEIISDGMVLQRDKPIEVWSQANPGERVKVEFAGKSKETVADGSGSWSAKLSRLTAATTPRTRTMSGENKIVLTNILVGDVWLASGQSNMEMAMSGLGAPAMGAPATPSMGTPASPATGGIGQEGRFHKPSLLKFRNTRNGGSPMPIIRKSGYSR
jgi:hypothetical protein